VSSASTMNGWPHSGNWVRSDVHRDGLARSWLYVPGDRAERVGTALRSPADAVVIDLEDAVAPAHKSNARDQTADLLGERQPKPVWVRINSLESGWARDDVEAIASPALSGVRIPKCESSESIREVANWLARSGLPVRIHALVESAVGLERIGELARAGETVWGVSLGEADLSADLGVDGDEGLLYARGRCVAASRAAGLAPPVQSVFPRLGDDAGLRASTELGRRLGFFGRSAIHPQQLPTINQVHTPSADVVTRARVLIDEMATAEARGVGAFVLADGRFVDRAVVADARRTVELATALERPRP
jgi:citrate lyase subunit beta/citryl-CoA lyase